MLAIDNLMKKAVVDALHEFLANLATPEFNLPESISDHCDLISRLKSALECYENEGQVL